MPASQPTTLLFKMRNLVLAALSSASVLLVAEAGGHLPGEIFSEHAATILSNSVCEIDGFVFFHGRAESTAGGSAGIGKAKAMAYGHLADYVRDNAEWPKDATPADRLEAWDQLTRERPDYRQVNGAETVRTLAGTNGFFSAVIAIPRKSLMAARPSRRTLAKAVAKIQGAAAAKRETPPSPAPERIESSGISTNGKVIIHEVLSGNEFL